MNDQVYVISAAPFEVEKLLNSFAETQIRANYLECGIGALRAAANAKHIAQTCQNQHVIFVGSCGSFFPFRGCRLFRASKVIWLDYGERLGRAYKIKDSLGDYNLDKSHPAFSSIEEKSVLCSATISLSPELPKDFRKQDWLENIELYSLAQPVGEVAKSFTALLCSTNSVGNNAHEQWKKNYKTAAHESARLIIERLAGFQHAVGYC